MVFINFNQTINETISGSIKSDKDGLRKEQRISDLNTPETSPGSEFVPIGKPRPPTPEEAKLGATSVQEYQFKDNSGYSIPIKVLRLNNGEYSYIPSGHLSVPGAEIKFANDNISFEITSGPLSGTKLTYKNGKIEGCCLSSTLGKVKVSFSASKTPWRLSAWKDLFKEVYLNGTEKSFLIIKSLQALETLHYP